MSGKQPPESGSSNSSKDLPGILDFLSSVFPETNVETLAALLSAAGDDPTRVADRLIRQEAIDHQECVVDIATGEEEDPLAMLQSVYPLLSPSLIQSAWIRCNGDVALAAEHLLNPSEEIPLTARILPPKAERGNSGDIVLQVPKKSKNGKTSSSNDTTDALTLQLAAVFPDQPLDLLRQVLQESQGKLDVAAMKVSQWTLDDFRKEPDLKPRASRDVASLQTLFPSRSKATLESLLERYGHLDAVVDYLSMVDESAVGFSDKDLADLCEGDCISSGFPCLLHASDSATTRASLPIGSKRETWNGEAALDVFQRDPTYGASSTHRSSNHRRTTSSNHESQVISRGSDSTLDHGAHYYRSKAAEIREQRNAFYQRACEAFKRGDMTGSGTAAYYSQEARKLESELKGWVQKAVDATVQQNQTRLGREASSAIDVHGLTVVEAIQFVEERVNTWFNYQGSMARPTKKLKVITGIGRHSHGGVSRLYPALMKYLRQKGWELRVGEDNGHFFVLP